MQTHAAPRSTLLIHRLRRLAAAFFTLAAAGSSVPSVLGLCGSVLAAESAEPRPNIVFLLADDLGYADCGFNGGKDIRTPHLDRLASRGAVLDSFYVQPVCSPTRAALMTGRYPMRYGLQVGVIRPWAKYGLPLEERTLAQGLRDAGYDTAICGKWHLGSFDPAYWPRARGFDFAYGHLFGALDYFTHIRDGQLDWYRDGQPLEQEGYTTDLLAREAVGWLERRDDAKPFFLYVAFNAVHTPLQVPESYKAPYSELPEPRRTLAGMLAALDAAVGQVVAAVETRGLRERTLFIFSSDNGGYAPGRVTDNGPLRAGKGTLYEGGVRAAAFATWDGHIPSGGRVRAPLHMVDWYPTLLKLAGATLDQPLPLDGRDAWPAITEGQPSPHEEILLNATPRSGAIRVDDWKLVLGGGPTAKPKGAKKKAGKTATAAKKPATGGQRVELFQLAEDLGERNNLAEQHPDKVQQLTERYRRLAAQAATPRNTEAGANP